MRSSDTESRKHIPRAGRRASLPRRNRIGRRQCRPTPGGKRPSACNTEEERDAPAWLIAQFNATIALHADRQIYARDSDFMYRMAHNERIMRGDEFLADQATVRPSEDD